MLFNNAKEIAIKCKRNHWVLMTQYIRFVIALIFPPLLYKQIRIVCLTRKHIRRPIWLAEKLIGTTISDNIANEMETASFRIM